MASPWPTTGRPLLWLGRSGAATGVRPRPGGVVTEMKDNRRSPRVPIANRMSRQEAACARRRRCSRRMRWRPAGWRSSATPTSAGTGCARPQRTAFASAYGARARRCERSSPRPADACGGAASPPRPVPGPQGAVVHPIAAATCDLDRALIPGRTPFALPLCIGHECVAEVLATGDQVIAVRPSQRVVVPAPDQLRDLRPRAPRGHTANCTAVPPISVYGFGIGGGHSRIVPDKRASALALGSQPLRTTSGRDGRPRPRSATADRSERAPIGCRHARCLSDAGAVEGAVRTPAPVPTRESGVSLEVLPGTDRRTNPPAKRVLGSVSSMDSPVSPAARRSRSEHELSYSAISASSPYWAISRCSSTLRLRTWSRRGIPSRGRCGRPSGRRVAFFGIPDGARLVRPHERYGLGGVGSESAGRCAHGARKGEGRSGPSPRRVRSYAGQEARDAASRRPTVGFPPAGWRIAPMAT
jgi:hypothetical protein